MIRIFQMLYNKNILTVQTKIMACIVSMFLKEFLHFTNFNFASLKCTEITVLITVLYIFIKV